MPHNLRIISPSLIWSTLYETTPCRNHLIFLFLRLDLFYPQGFVTSSFLCRLQPSRPQWPISSLPDELNQALKYWNSWPESIPERAIRTEDWKPRLAKWKKEFSREKEDCKSATGVPVRSRERSVREYQVQKEVRHLKREFNKME